MGDWQGTFWGAHRVAIDNTGQFTIKDGPGGKIVRGDIWLNLKDATLNFKIPARYHGDKTNDYYGTYEPPSTIKIVKQENGNEKALTKIRTLPGPAYRRERARDWDSKDFEEIDKMVKKT